MPNPESERKPGDLTRDAKASLQALLKFRDVRCDQWYMRMTVGGRVCDWELLTDDSEKNKTMIKTRIGDSKEPVADLVLAFLGVMDWRSRKQLMAHMQFFRRG